MTNLNVPLEECLKMACVNPGRKHGFLNRKGTIVAGKDGKIFNEAYIDSIRK